jgi:hypothetical protein
VDDEVSMGESIWHASFFIGMPRLGPLGSAFTLIALLLNVALQTLMCMVINDALTPPAFAEADVEDMRTWRERIAHDEKFVDDSGKSLPHTLCQFNNVPMSAGPMDALELISAYIPHREDKEYKPGSPFGDWTNLDDWIGVVMCRVAMVIWWLDVLKEAFSISGVWNALLALPTGSATDVAETSSGLQLERLTSQRRMLVCVVLFVRSLVCAFLLLLGTVYLCHTISLGDLLLNAMALEVVLNVDEMIFEILAPWTAKKLVRSLAPLRRPRGPQNVIWRGMDLRPVIAMCSMAGLVAWANFRFLTPQYELLDRIRDELCGGNREFVGGMDGAGVLWVYSSESCYDGNAYYHASPHYQVPEDMDDDEYVRIAYRQVIGLNTSVYNDTCGVSSDDSSVSLFQLTDSFQGSQFSVVGASKRSVQDITNHWNPTCHDTDRKSHEGHWRLFSRILTGEIRTKRESSAGVREIQTCVDVRPICYADITMSVRARQFCPQTCGCDDPASPQMHLSPAVGCPPSCSDVHYSSSSSQLRQLDCKDWTLQHPRMFGGIDLLDAYFSSWKVSYHYSQAYANEVREHVDTINRTLRESGCAGLIHRMKHHPNWTLGDLCEVNNAWTVRPITSICPESCRCGSDDHSMLCPSQCFPAGQPIR